MRLIKFRAWLPGIEIMTNEHTLDELMNWDTKPEDNGTAVWLQWTGLEDRNKKPIYEGDIIESASGHRKYVVTWDQEETGFFGKMIGRDESNFIKWKNFVVIGNIYETPELLKDIGPTE